MSTDYKRPHRLARIAPSSLCAVLPPPRTANVGCIEAVPYDEGVKLRASANTRPNFYETHLRINRSRVWTCRLSGPSERSRLTRSVLTGINHLGAVRTKRCDTSGVSKGSHRCGNENSWTAVLCQLSQCDFFLFLFFSP